MPEPGFVQIIHPGLGPGSVSEVPETSLGQHHAAGWRLLAEDDLPAPAPAPAPEPEPVTKAQAAKTAKPASKSEE
jgi:hypothetical protein